MFNGGNADFSMPVMPAYSNGGNNGGMGGWGDGGWWVLIILFAIFGWGGNGFGGYGGNGAQSALTRGELCQDMNFQSVENAVRGIQQGLCDGFYAVNTSLLNGFNGVDNAVCTLGYQTAQGFHGVDNAICSLGYNVQQGFNQTNVAMMQGQNAIQTQLAQCCCENRAGQADIKYQMATDTCAIQNTIQNTTRDIIDNNNANTRSVLDFLVNDKISTLQQENQNLKLAASQAAQNNYLLSELKPCPQPAYLTCNPFTGQYGGYGYNGYGYNNGCGCNSGCCGCNA
ncbi:MAG: hypothetical protein K2M46_14425 [Lachnospiraceae bacterium]|nr:hypothetical protein [Lachnospiraceae bacterium]